MSGLEILVLIVLIVWGGVSFGKQLKREKREAQLEYYNRWLLPYHTKLLKDLRALDDELWEYKRDEKETLSSQGQEELRRRLRRRNIQRQSIHEMLGEIRNQMIDFEVNYKVDSWHRERAEADEKSFYRDIREAEKDA